MRRKKRLVATGVATHARLGRAAIEERAAFNRREDAVFEREMRRARDLDDGIVWPDDH